MKPFSFTVTGVPSRPRGVAAVELAIIMCLTVFLLPTIFLFGRVFLHYNVLKQATQDAANYMASISPAEAGDPDSVAAATATAQLMVRTAVGAAGITPAATLTSIYSYCNAVETCGVNRPVTVTVTAILTINGADFNAATLQWLNDYLKWNIPASSTVAYAN